MAGSSNTPRKDFLPQDKRLRLLVQLIIFAIGLYAVVSGVGQMTSGAQQLSAPANSQSSP